MNIPYKILPPCLDENPKGEVPQSYSFRIVNGIANYFLGAVNITNKMLEQQSKKNLEQKAKDASNEMNKIGLTQIFRINIEYQRK